MKKFVVGSFALVALALASTSPALADWKAVATVDDSDPRYYWWGWGTGDSEEEARANAIDMCEDNSSRTCNETRSVKDWWYLVISNCGGYVSTGGSKHNYDAANARAAYNAGYNGQCRVLKKF